MKAWYYNTTSKQPSDHRQQGDVRAWAGCTKQKQAALRTRQRDDGFFLLAGLQGGAGILRRFGTARTS